MSGSGHGIFIETPASKTRYYQEQQQQQQQSPQQQQQQPASQRQKEYADPSVLLPYQQFFFLLHVFLFALLLSALGRVYVMRALRWLSRALARASEILSGVGGNKRL